MKQEGPIFVPANDGAFASWSHQFGGFPRALRLVFGKSRSVSVPSEQLVRVRAQNALGGRWGVRATCGQGVQLAHSPPSTGRSDATSQQKATELPDTNTSALPVKRHI